MLKTGAAQVGVGPAAISLPLVTKQDLAQYALWAMRWGQFSESAEERALVEEKVNRLYPILLDPDVMMLSVRADELGFSKLGDEMRQHLERLNSSR